MTTSYILRNIFFVLFLNKLYKAIIKRKLQQCGYIKIHSSCPPGLPYFFLLNKYIWRKKRTFIEKAENGKSWHCKNNVNLQKELQLLTIFVKYSFLDVWQSPGYA